MDGVTKECQSGKEASSQKWKRNEKSKMNALSVKHTQALKKNVQTVKKNAQAVKNTHIVKKNTQAVKRNAQTVKNTQAAKKNTQATKKNTQAVKKNTQTVKNAQPVKKNAQSLKKNPQALRENPQAGKENAHAVKKNAHPIKKSAQSVKKKAHVKKSAQTVKKAQTEKKGCKTPMVKIQSNSVKCRKHIQSCDEILCNDEKESSEAKDLKGSSTQGGGKGRRKQLNPRKAQISVVSDNTCTASKVNIPENSFEGNDSKEEIVFDKKTRGKRKKKKSDTYDFDIMDEDDIDIDYDSPADEYRPPRGFDEDNVHDEFEEENIVKVKRLCKVRNYKKKQDSEQKRGIKRVLKNEVTESAAHGMKKAKRIWMKENKIDTGSQTGGYGDMPDITADDFSTKAKVNTKKRKRKLQSHVLKKKSCLDEITDWDRDDDEDDPGEGDEDADLNQDDKLIKPKKESRHGQPYSVTGSWYIASGYLQDLTSLLEAFEREEGWKFKNFSSCWQELKFSLIYRGRENFKELLEFSEEVALLTKRFLVPPHSLKWRVGALYTLYGLYYKHPFRHFFKVRLVRDEYEQLLKLVGQFRTDVDNSDPAYIFRKMEIEGAFHYVATSNEMCLDFYSVEREAVDIKYESQRLVNASPISIVLSPDSRFIDDCLLQQYQKTKALVMGDGNEPERAVSLVQPSFPLEIDHTLKELKEDILIQLGLKEPPSKIVKQNEDQNELPPIGTRRAYIRAKALAVDTSEEYLKKKGLVGGFSFKGKTGRIIQKRRRGRPAKKEMEENMGRERASSCNNENMTGRLSKRSGGSTNKSRSEVSKYPRMLMDKNVRRFMSPPSAGTLRIPLKPRKKGRVLSNKLTYKTEGEESGVGSESEVDKDHTADEPLGQKELEASSRTEISSCANTEQDFGEEHLNAVPQVSPPPKRKRGRPRKNVLYKALEVSKGNSPPKEKVPQVFVGQRGRLNRYLRDMFKTQRLDKPTVINTLDAAQIHSNIIDLPSEETSIVLPMQREGITDECSDNSLSNLGTTYGRHTKGNNALPAQDSINDSICLDVHFNQKGTSIIRKMKFKVKTKIWESIENDKVKIENLKKKLLQLLPDENQSEEGKVNIVTQISASVPEGSVDASELSQSPSHQDVNAMLHSSAVQFQLPRKANKPVSHMTELHSGVFPLLSTREKGKGMTRPGVGKMLMVPIKIGGVTHYLPASPSQMKVNDKGLEYGHNKSLSLPLVKREVSEVTPIIDNYQIPQSTETSETPRKLADSVRAESPDFISSDMKWVSPLPESEISYILSSAPVREDIHDGTDEISPIRRREYTCRTDTHSTQTIDGLPDELWESKDGRESPPESHAELERLTLRHRNHPQRVLATKSAQSSLNKPFTTKDQVYKACEANAGKTLEIIVVTNRDSNTMEVAHPEENNCYNVSESTSFGEISYPEVTDITSAEEIHCSEEDEDQSDCVDMVVDDFVNDMTSFDSQTMNSDVGSSLSEPVSSSIFYVTNAESHQTEKDISLSQAAVVSTVTPAELSLDVYPSETSIHASYTVIPDEVTSLALPSTSVAPVVGEELSIPVPFQPRQVQLSPSVMENVMIPVSDAQIIVQSSPQQMTVSTAPLTVSTPVSTWRTAEHVFLEDVVSASTSTSHGSLQSTPGWIHQSHHECIRPLTTAAVTAHYPDRPINMVTYQKVPVHSGGNSLSKFPEQPTQQSMLEIKPPRYPGVVQVSPVSLKSSPCIYQSPSISSPMVYPHTPQSDSLVGLRRLPDIMGSKLLKVKINDKTVFVPADRVLTSATRVTYATQLSNEPETIVERLVEKQDIYPSSVQSDCERNANSQEPTIEISSQGIIVDKKVESDILSLPRILSERTDSQHSSPSSSSSVAVNVSGVNCDIKTEDVKPFESCSKTIESRTAVSFPTLPPVRKMQVCSFLFSNKYKALSGMMETLGPATGTPVIPKKARVPFLLKQSLVPKKKS
ncbi:uncharacterized protein Pbp45 [Panulirus ornatus]|uniref:uncharacterized protein Pbp45 n=1 Tax=Panulirus ornatus TaxID=150431 RepID=UPI003A8B8461